MNPAPQEGSLEDRYAASCTSLGKAILLTKEGRSWGWITGTSIADLSSACQPFLALHSQVASHLALESYPLMLSSLMIFSRPFGTEPYTLRPADREAVAQNASALWERLEVLSALSFDPETGPPADDLGTYRSQYHAFQSLLVLEEKVAQKSRRLMREMMRNYPRAPMLLGTVFDLQGLLEGGGRAVLAG